MCTSPLKGWTTDIGRVFKVTNSNVKYLVYDYRKQRYNSYYDEPEFLPDGAVTTFIDIPCRQCYECYGQIRKEWIARAVAESLCHESMIFLTLTYSDYKIPTVDFIDDETGEIFTHNTLHYRDFQLFMKRLRKFLGKSVRFMVCGEYGTHTYRPHYHAIIFGCGLDDFSGYEVHSINSHGDTLFTCDDLERLWNNGYILCSSASVATISYVAGYVSKKTPHAKKFYDYVGVTPPFIRGSNKPGLGVPWFLSHIDDFSDSYDYVSVSTVDEPFKIKLTSNWKMKWEQKNIYYPLQTDRTRDIMCSDKYLTDYKKSQIDRRVRLFDHSFEHLDTDMTKDDYNFSRNTDFRNSYKTQNCACVSPA